MHYLRVKNWEEFQHYKDRSPPWIKLHRDLLRDYEFSCLQDASKLHLMLIWLLASQMDNKIPADPDFIKCELKLKGDIDFKPLIDNGFLIDDSGTLAACKQSAMPEAEREAEVEADIGSKEPIVVFTNDDCRSAVDHYNKFASLAGWPVVKKLTENRKKHLRARLSDAGGFDGWVAAIARASKIPGLSGNNDRNWVADFDFFMQQSSFIKLIEGGYDHWGKPKGYNGLAENPDDWSGEDMEGEF